MHSLLCSFCQAAGRLDIVGARLSKASGCRRGASLLLLPPRIANVSSPRKGNVFSQRLHIFIFKPADPLRSCDMPAVCRHRSIRAASCSIVSATQVSKLILESI